MRDKLIVSGIAGLSVVALVALLGPSSEPEDAAAPARAPATRPEPQETLGARTPALSARAAPRAAAHSPTAHRPATLHGTVFEAWGEPAAEREISLLDAQGDAVGTARSGADGSYRIDDADRGAVQVVVAGDAPQAWDLGGALGAGEVRRLDVVLGATREVAGWVLDMAGDPVPGALITMTAEGAEARWHAVARRDGGFRFAQAPEGPVRVDADGYDLGRASSRLAASADLRREVSLVVEPVAHITVTSEPRQGERVIVRCRDDRYHGADGLAEYAGVDAEEVALVDPRGEDSADDAHAEHVAMPEPEEMEELMTSFEAALRRYDPRRPKQSMRQMMRSVMTAHPVMEEMVRQDDALAELDLDALIATSVDTMFDDNPEIADQMARAAELVKAGHPLMEAMQAAAEESFAEAEQPIGHEVDVDGGESVEDEETARVLAETEAFEPDGEEILRFMPGDRSEEVASAAVGERFSVRGAFVYDVAIRQADGMELQCGQVFVNAGDEVVVPCGTQAQDAGLVGRVVDHAGQPAAGLRVSTWADGQELSATTDWQGRFTVRSQLRGSVRVTVQVRDPQGTYAKTERRQVVLLGGETVDIGVLEVRRHEELPPPWMTESFGGIGGLVAKDEVGVYIQDIEADVPLELAGVEPGDTITRIDGDSAAHMPMWELLERLRGEVGTSVALQVRTDAGELYEVSLTRDLIPPGSESWDGEWTDEELASDRVWDDL